MNDMDELKNLLHNNAFLGRGWSFPLELTENGVRMSSYEKDIEESLRILFSTAPGERVGRYDYGCPLRRYAFEPLTTQTLVRMRGDITRAVILFEPRIHAGRCVVRGTADGRTVADTPHLHRGAYQQPRQHGLSVLFE